MLGARARKKQLVAWLVSTSVPAGQESESTQLTRDELGRHLRVSLPDWMIPARFVLVDSLPLTASGKIDRKALPAPDGDARETGSKYTAPRNSTEEMLCGIFAEILGMDLVGIHDDFFYLGGHSLLSMQLLSSIRKVSQVDIPLRVLFQYPTPKGLATAIRAKEEWKQTILLPLKIGGSEAPPILHSSRGRRGFLLSGLG